MDTVGGAITGRAILGDIADELEPGRYIMMTIRSHDQFPHAHLRPRAIYGGIYNGRRVIFMNEEDIGDARLHQGPAGRSHEPLGDGEERMAWHFLVAPYAIPRGCSPTYFPEANVLVPINSVAKRSNTPTSKFVIISIALSAGAAPAAGDPSHPCAGASACHPTRRREATMR